MNDFIIIPGTGIRLYDGYIITLTDYPGDTFIVKHGYYHNAEDTEVFGWYFISTMTSESLEVTDELLLTVTILMPTYPQPQYPTTGNVVQGVAPINAVENPIDNTVDIFINLDNSGDIKFTVTDQGLRGEINDSITSQITKLTEQLEQLRTLVDNGGS